MGNGEPFKVAKWAAVIATIIIFLLGVTFSAGWSFATFATRDELSKGLDDARREREVKMELMRQEQETKVEKALVTHNEQQEKDAKRLWDRLDRMEGKLDRLDRTKR